MASTRPPSEIGNNVLEERVDCSIIEAKTSTDESRNEDGGSEDGGSEDGAEAAPSTASSMEFPELASQVPATKSFSRQGSRALLRHYVILAGCILASTLILGLSCINLPEMIERPALLNEKMQPSYDADNVVLAPHLSFMHQDSFGPREAGTSFKEGLRPVYESSWDAAKIGFVDTSGKIVIKPQFSKVGDFHDGLAPAIPWRKRKENEATEPEPWGVIDTTGKFVIQPQFREAPFFSHGIAAVQLIGDGKGESAGGLIDRTGRFLIRTPSADGPPVRFGDLIRMKAEKQDDLMDMIGLMDKNGKWAVKPVYHNIKKPDLSTDADYDKLFPGSSEAGSDPPYLFVSYGGTGVIDHSGRVLILPFFKKIGKEYADIQSFHNKHAKVKVNDKFGIIDKSGKFVIPPEYDRLTPFGELIAGQKGEKWSVMDDKGKAIAAPMDLPIFQRDRGWFEDGLAPVFYKEKCGYLNRNGKFAIEPRYVVGTTFHNGIARVYDGSLWHFINTKGEAVSPGFSWLKTPMQDGEARANLPGPLYFVSAGSRAADVERDVSGYQSRLEELPSQAWD